ncbi:hypothetical protein [Zavarzinella formosa]|uniref:hypothetical protein n=1 Tax=Zavarzinella formosa TaxID=360055 RepID=UPI000362F076|nr:hypothetical protein [Zavarzinella formosa]
MIGKKIGFLEVILRGTYWDPAEKRAYWICLCVCGKQIGKFGYTLRDKKSKFKSCGCKKSEVISSCRTTHGLTKTPEYSIWQGIKHRCFLRSDMSYAAYGGRGVTMCDRWKDSFESFLEDMGKRPAANYSIDRINFNGDYSLENCRWATKEVQANNTRTNVFYEYKGKNLTWAQWERECGIKQHTLAYRYRKGLRNDDLFKITR